MKISIRTVYLAGVIFLPLLAVAQGTAPAKVSPLPTPTPQQKRGDRPASTASSGASAQSAAGTAAQPSPTPTPPRLGPASLAPAPIPKGPQKPSRPNPAGLAPAAVAGGLKYSPTQLDFGAIDYGASSKRTFSLTPPVAGEITLEFPVGSFVAAELRRVPPLVMGKPQAQLTKVPPMKPAPSSSTNQTQTYKWSFAAGEEMQLDVLFAPSFSKDKTPGLHTATMKFSGPGSITPWTVTIPMRGTVNGSKVDLSPQITSPPLVNRSSAAADRPPTAGVAASHGTLLLSALQKKTAPRQRNSRWAHGHINPSIMAALTEQRNAVTSIRALRNQVPMSKPQSAPGNASPNNNTRQRAAAVPAPNPMGQASMPEVVHCVATSKIRMVDGKYKGAVFTPIIPDGNGNYQVPQHVIQGCYFGKQQGSAYLFGNFKKVQLPLNINYWSDSEIDAALDPTLEGELDEDNVTLVVKLADGTQLKATGFKFYAARGEPIPLQVIPSYAFKAQNGTAPTNFVTPQSNNSPGAYLTREKWQLIPRAGAECKDPLNSSTLTQGSDAGVDYYEFSKLTQGFTTDSYSSVYWFNGANDCRSVLKVDTNNYCYKGPSVTSGDNKLDVQWDGDNIRVAWRNQLCAWNGWEKDQNGAWNPVVDVYGMSRYALTVYVVGPKGVTPWADGKQ